MQVWGRCCQSRCRFGAGWRWLGGMGVVGPCVIVGTAGPVGHRMEEAPGTVGARGVVVAGTIEVGTVVEGSIA